MATLGLSNALKSKIKKATTLQDWIEIQKEFITTGIFGGAVDDYKRFINDVESGKFGPTKVVMNYPQEVIDAALNLFSPLDEQGVRVNPDIQTADDLADPKKLLGALKTTAEAIAKFKEQNKELAIDLGAEEAANKTYVRELEARIAQLEAENNKVKRGGRIKNGVIAGLAAGLLVTGTILGVQSCDNQKKLDDVNAQVETLEGEKAGLNDTIAGLNDTIGKNNATIADLEDKLAQSGNYQELVGLREQLKGIADYLDSIGYQIQPGKSASDSIQSLYEDYLQKTVDYETAEDNYQRIYDAVESRLDEMFAAHPDANGVVLKFSDFKDENDAFDAIREIDRGHEAEIGQLQQDLADADQAATAAQAEIVSLKGTIKDLKTQIANLGHDAYSASEVSANDTSSSTIVPVASDDPTEIPTGSNVNEQGKTSNSDEPGSDR